MTLSEECLRIHVDAYVLLSGIAAENPSAASRVVLEVSDLTLLDLIAGQTVIDEWRKLSQIAPEEMSLESLRGFPVGRHPAH